MSEDMSYEQALAKARAAIEAVATHPGRPSDAVSVPLDVLDITMPYFHTLLHNHHYREAAVQEVVDRVLKASTMPVASRGVHGADGQVGLGAAIEVKTAQMPGRTLSQGTMLGMFDKVAARVEPAADLPLPPAWSALAARFGARVSRSDLARGLQEGGFEIPAALGHPIRIDSPRRARRLLQILDAAGVTTSSGLAAEPPSGTAKWPPTTTMNGAARYPHTCFGLFAKDSPRPLLVIHMPSASLEEVLGDRFEAAAARLADRMAMDRSQRAPSARDSLDLTLADVMREGTGARIVWVDFARLSSLGVTLSEPVAEWASRPANALDRQLALRIASDLCREPAPPTRRRGVR